MKKKKNPPNRASSIRIPQQKNHRKRLAYSFHWDLRGKAAPRPAQGESTLDGCYSVFSQVWNCKQKSTVWSEHVKTEYGKNIKWDESPWLPERACCERQRTRIRTQARLFSLTSSPVKIIMFQRTPTPSILVNIVMTLSLKTNKSINHLTVQDITGVAMVHITSNESGMTSPCWFLFLKPHRWKQKNKKNDENYKTSPRRTGRERAWDVRQVERRRALRPFENLRDHARTTLIPTTCSNKVPPGNRGSKLKRVPTWKVT